MIEILDQTRLFKGLSYDQLNDITHFSECLLLNDGDILIHEGDETNADIFVLSEGNVEIVSNTTGLTSGEVVLSSENKEVFGEISWLTNARRTASVRCHGNAEVIRVDGKKLMSYLEANPEAGFIITRRIAELLSKRMEESNRLLKQILWNEQV